MLLQGAESYSGRRKRPGEYGGEAEADQPDVISKPLTPPITATSANGPIASVPAPQVGAPSKQPVLQAPQPTAPAAPQSVASIALGTAPKVNMAPPVVAPAPASAVPTPQVGAPEPIKTLSGDWQAPTASAQSAPLIASAAGGTMTPQGDSANSFRGYQTDQGGTFGGYGTAIMPDTGTTMKDYDTKVGEGIKGFNFDFSQIDPTELQKISQMSVNANGAETDQGDALRLKLSQGGQLTPTEQYFLAFQSGQTPQIFRPTYGASGASPTGWKQSANDMNALGGAKTMQEWAAKQAPKAAAPVNAGNWTAKDPAEQQRLLAEMAAGTIPSGPSPAVGAPGEVAVARPGGVQTTTAPGGAGGGGGTPAVGVGPSGTPALPSTPAPAVGAPGSAPADVTDLDPVQQAMRAETLRRLQNPSPYDDELWQKEVGKAKASSDETWGRNRDNLDADLAARGINWSSIAGDKLSDFNTAKSRSWDDTLTGFLSDRAKGIGAARDQAFNAGSTERTYYDDLRQQATNNQFDVTKLQEALRQGREGTEMDWTKLGLDALGNSTSGAADLGAGAAASAGNTGTGDYLAQWLAQFYGKQAPKPGVGKPTSTYPTGTPV